MGEGNSIINLGDLSKPVTVFIEKIASAAGILYEPKRIKNKAKAEIESKIMVAHAEIELTEIQKRGLERLIHQEATKQKNIEAITEKAIHSIDDNANVQDLDEDWIAHFFDKCGKVSDEKMQFLWANLLSNEASKPGTYSKRTINFVSTMEKADAELFTKLCQFVVVVGEPAPVIIEFQQEIYIKAGLGFTELKHLNDIGLISLSPTTGYTQTSSDDKGLMYYFNQPVLLEFTGDNRKFNIGKALFTKAGSELFSVCQPEKNEEFIDYFIANLLNQGISARRAVESL